MNRSIKPKFTLIPNVTYNVQTTGSRRVLIFYGLCKVGKRRFLTWRDASTNEVVEMEKSDKTFEVISVVS
jgi:hypothetical protein